MFTARPAQPCNVSRCLQGRGQLCRRDGGKEDYEQEYFGGRLIGLSHVWMVCCEVGKTQADSTYCYFRSNGDFGQLCLAMIFRVPFRVPIPPTV